MQTLRNLILSVAVAIACAACVPMDREVNHPLDISMAGQFRPGISTVADIERVYGPPARVLNNSANGHSALLYAYAHVRGTGFGPADVKDQSVLFVFDANGKFLEYRTSGGSNMVH